MDESLLAILKQSARTESVELQVMLPNANPSGLRAAQEEDRSDEDFRRDQVTGVTLLLQELPGTKVRQMQVYPSFFAIQTSDVVLVSTYLYTTGSFQAPVIIYRRQQDLAGPYESYSKDIERLWSKAESLIK